MLANAQLPVARKLHQRLSFEHAAFILAEIAERFAVEEEVAAIDPGIGQIRLFRERDDLVVIEFELAKARGWIDAEHGGELSIFHVQRKLIKQIGVGDAVTIGYREVRRIAEILRCGTRDAGPGHGQRAGVGERHGPILPVIDLVDGDVVGVERDGEIAVERRVIEKI